VSWFTLTDIQIIYPIFNSVSSDQSSSDITIKTRIFCMSRINTRTKLRNILFHLVMTIFNFLIFDTFSSGKQTLKVSN
jgi:hypothetical protein